MVINLNETILVCDSKVEIEYANKSALWIRLYSQLYNK